MNVLLIGNPNVGKTSLFNHLTGSAAHVGNYPGVTVERRKAKLHLTGPDGKPLEVTLTDAPGTYSLSARSQEEQIAISAVLGHAGIEKPDLVVCVLNATQLSRNLYLSSQLLELRVPVLFALNMMDEAGTNPPDSERLSELLGAPCCPTNGSTGEGVKALRAAIAQALLREKVPLPRLNPRFLPELLEKVDRVADALPNAWKGSVERNRALSLWALSSLEEGDELVGIEDALRKKVAEVRADSGEFDIDLAMASGRYAAIDVLMDQLGQTDTSEAMSPSERIDRVLLHPVGGFVSFLLTMLVVFQALFAWSDPMIGWIEDLVGFSSEILKATLPPSLLTDLVIEGVIGGVGNVVVFLPQILLLFLFIGILEDSGYMARVAYLMDRVMRSLGLHGRAFVPLLSGFACAVPAILATRTLENRRDQLLTMMVVPLMTCSARLPVYTLIIAALFPVDAEVGWPLQGALMVALYLFSVVTSFVAAFVLGRTVIPGKSMPLILELPRYRWPRLGPTLRMMRLRAGQFLKEAGTVILAATILLWGLLTFPRTDESPVDKGVAALSAESSTGQNLEPSVPGPASLQNSYAGRLGRAFEPLVEPLGFDWKIATGIIGAFAAREVFISTLALVYEIGEVDDEALPLRERIRQEKKPDGTPVYTPLVGLSLMIFFALACQCMSTLAVVKRETQSWRWPTFLFVYMTTLAYLSSLLVYQGGRLLGY